MLCLSEKDITAAAGYDEVLKAVEEAMLIYEEQSFKMPDRMHVDDDGTTLLLMPCFTPRAFGTKLVTVTPENDRKNLPVVNGIMILNEKETGRPLAMLNGAVLTALRTGALGGVAARQLAPARAHTLGIVGLGVQGLSQALFVSHVRPISDLYLFDTTPAKLKIFIVKFAAVYPKIKIHAVGSAADLLKNAEIVITATTSNRPVLPDDPDLLQGRTYIAVGSYKPDMRELPAGLFRLCGQVFTDTDLALQESGDLVFPLREKLIQKDRVFTLGKWLQNDPRIVKPGQGTALFKSVGMALFDVIVAHLLYQKAVSQGIGTELRI